MESEPDIICFPEWSLPPRIHSEPNEFAADAEHAFGQAANYYAERTKDIFMSGLRRMPSKDGTLPFVFFGSVRDADLNSNFNSVWPGGLVQQNYEEHIAWSSSPNGVEHQLRRTIERGVFVYSQDQAGFEDVGFSAYMNQPIVRRFRTSIGQVCVLTGRELFDVNRLAYISEFNRRADLESRPERISLILVPSYTASELAIETCQNLSSLARTNVLFSNASGIISSSIEDSTRQRVLPLSRLFFCGFTEKEMQDSGFITSKSLEQNLVEFDLDLMSQNRFLSVLKNR